MSYGVDARHRIRGGRGGMRTVSAPNESGNGSMPYQRRPNQRGRGNWKKRGGGGGGRGYGQGVMNSRSRPEAAIDEEGDQFMADVSPPQRFAPYQRQRRGQRQVSSMDSRKDVGVRSRLGFPGSGGSQGVRRSGWNKVTIPNGAVHSQEWLLRQLQSHVSEPFTPVEFHICGELAAFFVQEQRAAQELKQVKIRTRDGSMLTVNVKPSSGPQHRDAHFSQTPFNQTHRQVGNLAEGAGSMGYVTLSGQLTPEQEEVLKLALGNRYNITTNALNLSEFYFDEVLKAHGMRGIVSRADFLDSVLRIIQDSCSELVSLDLSNNRIANLDGCINISSMLPNLHHLGLANNLLRSEIELVKLKDCPKLVALSLEGNPFVSQLSSSYASTVQSQLPNVTSLDGQQLAPKIGFDLPTKTELPEAKSSFAINPQIKQFVYKFLETYYNLYDSPGGREKLLDAYTDDALFSLAVTSVQDRHHKGPPVTEYLQHSRNLLRVKPAQKNELIRRGRLQIASLIHKLPLTRHDLGTFTVDIALATATCTCFTVWGLFQETTFGSRPVVRCFSRVFVCIPSALGSNLTIVNDQLHIRNATPLQMKAFDQLGPVPQPSFDQSSTNVLGAPSGLAVSGGLVSPTGLPIAEQKSLPLASTGGMVGLNPQQQEMIIQFSKESGMNLEWSQKCLAQNNWVYLQSAQAFTVLQSNSSIPPEAFVKQ